MRLNLNERYNLMWMLDYWYLEWYFHFIVEYFIQSFRNDVPPLAQVLQQLLPSLLKSYKNPTTSPTNANLPLIKKFWKFQTPGYFEHLSIKLLTVQLMF